MNRLLGTLCMIWVMSSCNVEDPDANNPLVNKKDTVQQQPSAPVMPKDTTGLQQRIETKILALPEVMQAAKHIDSLTNHQHSIALMTTAPKKPGDSYFIRAGYNGKDRFETYYQFYANPATEEIRIYDPVSDRKMTLEAYRQNQ
jgi:hypothetical protein